ncbi:hypothetical protein [Anaerovorax sp. IOR16]|uniref:hypothetical protein n=1 Tax=Anaerovorax sp. IOR16 TaxID=2773458 RepID=UPI0019D15698|nr:hypothetical protein [Anaerovorax sp. IOR16]
MYTGKEVFDIAVSIIDELSDSGTVNPSQVAEYQNRAPFLLDMWQREIGRLENKTDLIKITSLDQGLPISDVNCPSGAYYLAHHFALADQNDSLASVCVSKYRELKRTASKPSLNVKITDVYGGLV